MTYTIRQFNQSDYYALYQLLKHPSSYQFQSWKITTYEEASKFLDDIANLNDIVNYMVMYDDDNQLLGACQLSINKKHRSGEIGYIVSPEHYGKGHATYMGNYLLEYGFNQLDLNRIFATTDCRNIASYKVMEKLGMQFEGKLRQDKIVNNAFRDSYIYSILKSEYIGNNVR